MSKKKARLGQIHVIFSFVDSRRKLCCSPECSKIGLATISSWIQISLSVITYCEEFFCGKCLEGRCLRFLRMTIRGRINGRKRAKEELNRGDNDAEEG